MGGFVLIAALTLAACASAPAPAPPAPQALAGARHIEPASAVGFATSHDGARMLFTADPGGVRNAFAAPIGGGEPAQLTASTGADITALSYFPTDDRILLSRDGQLFVRNQDETLREICACLFLGWRQDEAAFFVSGPGGAVSTVDAADLSRTTLFTAPSADALVISRNGAWLAYRQRAALFAVDLTQATPSARSVTAAPAAALYEFAPDNRSLIYGVQGANGFIAARRYDLSAASTPAMDAEADVLSIVSSPSGRYAVYVTGTQNQIIDGVVVDQTADRTLPLDRHLRDVRFARDEDRIFFRLANDPWPQDIFAADLDGTHITRLVHIPGL